MKKPYLLINKYLNSELNICDVGAAGGISSRWEKIKNLFVIGFEPDEREYVKLRNSKNQKWFNIGLNHTKGNYPLYITNYQTNTSLYKPNISLINELCLSNDDFNIEKEIEIDCDSLDDILEVNNLSLDYIKLDTQGSELDILKGGNFVLERDIFAVESEVEFAELYKNQPLFTDFDLFMRKKGFILMDIGNMVHIKGKYTIGIGGLKSFLISGDALYFKSINQTIEMIKINGIDKLHKVIAICLVYGYNDYALEICYRIQNENVIPFDNLKDLIEDLKKIHNSSHYIPEFKYKTYLRKLFSQLSDLFNRTKNASWINNLGNN